MASDSHSGVKRHVFQPDVCKQHAIERHRGNSYVLFGKIGNLIFTVKVKR